MSDPFDPVSVHGVWPLVADPGEPGGMRFADMGRDGPSDCMVSPAALPEARVELRLFASHDACAAWCEAVAEFGGNALHARALDETAIAVALLIRYDAPPIEGDTLDACVGLVGTLPNTLARTRGAMRRERQSHAKDTAWRMAWARELAAVEDRGDLRLNPMDDPSSLERLVVTTRGHRLACAVWVQPREGGRRITLRMGHTRPFELRHADLNARLRAAVEGLGYSIGESDDPYRDVDGVDGTVLDAVMGDLAAMERARSAVHDEMVARSLVARAREGRPGAILQRLAAGFPVAKARASSTYAHQVNPVSGHGVDVDDYALKELWAAGAIRPAWWSNRNPGKPKEGEPFDAFEASIWVASELGAYLAGKDPDLVAAAERLAAARAEAWAIVSGTGPSPWLETLRGIEPREAWTPPRDAPVPRAPKGKAALQLPKRAKDLAQLAAWTVHGLDRRPADAA